MSTKSPHSLASSSNFTWTWVIKNTNRSQRSHTHTHTHEYVCTRLLPVLCLHLVNNVWVVCFPDRCSLLSLIQHSDAYPPPSHTPPQHIYTHPVQRSHKGMVETVWLLLHSKHHRGSYSCSIIVSWGVKALLSGYCSHKAEARKRDGRLTLPASLSF